MDAADAQSRRTTGIIIASLLLCFSCCCLCICGACIWIFMRGIPPKYIPQVEAVLKDLEAKGYLPELDASGQIVHGSAEKHQNCDSSGQRGRGKEEDDSLPELEELGREDPQPTVPTKPIKVRI
mmetsp:Transcript_21233/g.49401  ORF Transcript_21233/g.49401 Transcript_21233/m.49401 type:complete len:124 (+) Transcript_21233:54-425(+)